MKNKIIKKLLLYICSILSILNKYLGKKPNQIVFYSNLGFRDNVKALYDYIIEEEINKSYTIICSVSDYKKYKDTKLDNVVFTNCYFGVYYFLTSKYFFYCFGKYPITPSPNQIVINLWHGTPLKKIGNLVLDEEKITNKYFTYILATSEKFRKIMSEAFNCPEEDVLILGHPRNDKLFKPDNLNYKEKHNKLILWLPTFRKSTILSRSDTIINNTIPVLTTEEDYEEINSYLSKNNSIMIIKLHPLQDIDDESIIQYSNIKIYSHRVFESKEIDLYPLLGAADALITDYSSIYFDYLLLDRPMAFTIDDIKDYEDSRGFVFDNPLEYMPGFRIKTKSDFLNFLGEFFEGEDKFALERYKVNNVVNYYKDGNNSQRMLEFLNIK